MPNKPPAELIKFLQPYDKAIQKLALDLRKIVIDELAPCHENIYDAYSAVAIGYGTSERFSDGICHIAVYTQNVNLGFNQGASLDDPEAALLGSGKRIRHLSLKTQADLKRPEIRVFLKRALALARDDARKLGEPISRGKNSRTVISTVKAIYKKKRRPS
jgi:Domain of unknown function (DU1801)